MIGYTHVPIVLELEKVAGNNSDRRLYGRYGCEWRGAPSSKTTSTDLSSLKHIVNLREVQQRRAKTQSKPEQLLAQTNLHQIMQTVHSNIIRSATKTIRVPYLAL